MIYVYSLISIFHIILDWSRRAESSRSSRVPGPSRLDSGQDFGTEYSSRVTMLVSSIDPDSRPDPPRYDLLLLISI